MKKKQDKQKKSKLLGDRKKLNVSVFRDEFDKFGLKEDMTSFEAQTKVRESLDLPKRQRADLSINSRLRDKLKDLSEEQKEELLEKL